MSCSIVSSTACPALTITITLRGLLSEAARAFMSAQPMIFFPFPRPLSTKSSTFETVRL